MIFNTGDVPVVSFRGESAMAPEIWAGCGAST